MWSMIHLRLAKGTQPTSVYGIVDHTPYVMLLFFDQVDVHTMITFAMFSY
jgi:hypothetical protein